MHKTASDHPLFPGFLKRISQLSHPSRNSYSFDAAHEPKAAPLIISSRNDLTADHLYCVAIEKHHAARWLTYESILDGLVSFETVRDLIGHAPGVYVRHPFSEDPDIAVVATSVDAGLEGVRNLIQPSPHSSNWSKPMHILKLRETAGELNLAFPTSMVTYSLDYSDSTLCKGLSHLPTVAIRVGDAKWPPSAGPYLAQHILVGQELRIHVLDDLVFACTISKDKDEVDYRSQSSLDSYEVNLDISVYDDLVALSRSEGLRFSGIDVIQTTDCKYCVLEVNPMPGFHCYDPCPDYPIASALLNKLRGNG